MCGLLWLVFHKNLAVSSKSVVYTDASTVSYGAILLQKIPKGNDKWEFRMIDYARGPERFNYPEKQP